MACKIFSFNTERLQHLESEYKKGSIRATLEKPFEKSKLASKRKRKRLKCCYNYMPFSEEKWKGNVQKKKKKRKATETQEQREKPEDIHWMFEFEENKKTTSSAALSPMNVIVENTPAGLWCGTFHRDQSVRDVRTKVAERLGIRPESVCLRHRGKTVKSSTNLQELVGVDHDLTLNMYSGRLCGGMDKEKDKTGDSPITSLVVYFAPNQIASGNHLKVKTENGNTLSINANMPKEDIGIDEKTKCGKIRLKSLPDKTAVILSIEMNHENCVKLRSTKDEDGSCKVEIIEGNLNSVKMSIFSSSVEIHNRICIRNTLELATSKGGVRLNSSMKVQKLIIRSENQYPSIATNCMVETQYFEVTCKQFVNDGGIYPFSPLEPLEVKVIGELRLGIDGVIGYKNLNKKLSTSEKASSLDINVTSNLINLGQIAASQEIQLECKNFTATEETKEDTAPKCFQAIESLKKTEKPLAGKVDTASKSFSNSQQIEKPLTRKELNDLHLAIVKDDLIAVSEKLQSGVDPEIKASSGLSALDVHHKRLKEIKSKNLETATAKEKKENEIRIANQRKIGERLYWRIKRRGKIKTNKMKLTVNGALEDCGQLSISDNLVVEVKEDMIVRKNTTWMSGNVSGSCRRMKIFGVVTLDSLNLDVNELHIDKLGKVVLHHKEKISKVNASNLIENKGLLKVIGGQLDFDTGRYLQSKAARVVAIAMKAKLGITVREDSRNDWWGEIQAYQVAIESRARLSVHGDIKTIFMSRLFINGSVQTLAELNILGSLTSDELHILGNGQNHDKFTLNGKVDLNSLNVENQYEFQIDKSGQLLLRRYAKLKLSRLINVGSIGLTEGNLDIVVGKLVQKDTGKILADSEKGSICITVKEDSKHDWYGEVQANRIQIECKACVSVNGDLKSMSHISVLLNGEGSTKSCFELNGTIISDTAPLVVHNMSETIQRCDSKLDSYSADMVTNGYMVVHGIVALNNARLLFAKDSKTIIEPTTNGEHEHSILSAGSITTQLGSICEFHSNSGIFIIACEKCLYHEGSYEFSNTFEREITLLAKVGSFINKGNFGPIDILEIDVKNELECFQPLMPTKKLVLTGTADIRNPSVLQSSDITIQAKSLRNTGTIESKESKLKLRVFVDMYNLGKVLAVKDVLCWCDDITNEGEIFSTTGRLVLKAQGRLFNCQHIRAFLDIFITADTIINNGELFAEQGRFWGHVLETLENRDTIKSKLGKIELKIESLIHNSGSIECPASLKIEAGELLNEGILASDTDIVFVKSTRKIINVKRIVASADFFICGNEIINEGVLTTDRGNFVLRGSTLNNSTTGVINVETGNFRCTIAEILSNTGQLNVSEKIFVKTRQFLNDGTLQNSTDELELTIEGKGTNGNTGKISIFGQINVEAGIFENNGLLTSQSNLLNFEVSETMLNYGNISGPQDIYLWSKELHNCGNLQSVNGSIVCKIKCELKNSGTMKTPKEIHIKTDTLTNLKEGNILGDTGFIISKNISNSGKIEVSKSIEVKAMNVWTDGVMSTSGTLTSSITNSFENDGLIKSLDFLKMSTEYLKNGSQGELTSSEDMFLWCGDIHNEGKLVSGKTIFCKVERMLRNLNGFTGHVNVILETTDVFNRGNMTSETGTLQMKALSDISNEGELQAVETISLQSKELQNGEDGRITAPSGTLTAMSERLKNDGKIVIEKKVLLQTQEMDNTGILRCSDTLKMRATSVQNGERGEITSSEDLYIWSDDISNEGTLHSEKTIICEVEGNLRNLKDIRGHRNVLLETKNVFNKGTIVSETGSLQITAIGTISNEGELHAVENISMQSKELHNCGDGRITAPSGTLICTVSETLQNNGKIVTKKEISLQTHEMTNNGVLCSSDVVKCIVSTSLRNNENGAITATGNTTMYSMELVNQGIISSETGNIFIESLRDLQNNGNIESSKDILLKSLSVKNDGTVNAKRGILELVSNPVKGIVANRGTFKACHSLGICVGKLVNEKEISSKEICIDALNIRNDWEIQSVTDCIVTGLCLENKGVISAQNALQFDIKNKFENIKQVQARKNIEIKTKFLLNKGTISSGVEVVMNNKENSVDGFSTIMRYESDIKIFVCELQNANIIHAHYGNVYLAVSNKCLNDGKLRAYKNIHIKTISLENNNYIESTVCIVLEADLIYNHGTMTSKFSEPNDLDESKSTARDNTRNSGETDSATDFYVKVRALINKGTMVAREFCLDCDEAERFIGPRTVENSGHITSLNDLCMRTGRITNTESISSVEGEIVLDAFEMIRNCGEIVSLHKCIIRASSLDNVKGIVVKEGFLQVKVLREIMNSGNLLAANEMRLQSTSLFNYGCIQSRNSFVIFEIEMEMLNHRTIKAADSILVKTTSFANADKAQLESDTEVHCDIITNLENNGQMKAGKLLRISALELKTNGELVSAEITVATIKATNIGDIVSSGKITCDIEKMFMNEGRIDSSTSLKIRAMLLKNGKVGKMVTATDLDILCSEVINEGEMHSQAIVCCKAEKRIFNKKDIIGCQGIVFETAKAINEGKVVSRGTFLQLKILEDLTNNGEIESASDIFTESGQLQNEGDIRALGSFKCLVRENFTNKEIIDVNENLLVTANDIINDGEMHSKTIVCKAVATIFNGKDIIGFQGVVVETSKAINKGKLVSKGVVLQLKIQDNVTNNGEIQSESDIFIKSGQLLNEGSITALGRLKCIVRENFINKDTIDIDTKILVTANEISNHGTLISSEVKCEAVDVIQNTGYIKSSRYLHILSAKRFRNDGDIETNNDFLLSIHEVENHGSLHVKEGSILINTVDGFDCAGTMENGGDIQTSVDLYISSGSVVNNKKLDAGGQMFLYVLQKFQNYDAIESELDVTISAKHIENQKSIISRKGVLKCYTAESLVNFGSLTSLDDMQIQTKVVSNNGTMHTQNGTLVFDVETILNTNELKGFNQVTITANHVQNNGTLSSTDKSVKILASKSLENDGTIEANCQIILRTNQAQNKDKIFARKNISIQAQSLENNGKISSETESLKCEAETFLRNIGEIVSSGAVIDISTAELQNEDVLHALQINIHASNKLLNAGDIIANQQIEIKTKEFLNSKSIEALSSILLDANTAENSGSVVTYDGVFKCTVSDTVNNSGEISASEGIDIHSNIFTNESEKGILCADNGELSITSSSPQPSMLEGTVFTKRLKLENKHSTSFVLRCKGGIKDIAEAEIKPMFHIPSNGITILNSDGPVIIDSILAQGKENRSQSNVCLTFQDKCIIKQDVKIQDLILNSMTNESKTSEEATVLNIENDSLVAIGKLSIKCQLPQFTMNINEGSVMTCLEDISAYGIILSIDGRLDLTSSGAVRAKELHISENSRCTIHKSNNIGCQQGLRFFVTDDVVISGQIYSEADHETWIHSQKGSIIINSNCIITLTHLGFNTKSIRPIVVWGTLIIQGALKMFDVSDITFETSSIVLCQRFISKQSKKGAMLETLHLKEHSVFTIKGVTKCDNGAAEQFEDEKNTTEFTNKSFAKALKVKLSGMLITEGKSSVYIVAQNTLEVNHLFGFFIGDNVIFQSEKELNISANCCMELRMGRFIVTSTSTSHTCNVNCTIKGGVDSSEKQEIRGLQETSFVTEGFNIIAHNLEVRNISRISMSAMHYVSLKDHVVLENCRNIEIESRTIEFFGRVQNVSDLMQAQAVSGLFKGELFKVNKICFFCERVLVNSGKLESEHTTLIAPVLINTQIPTRKTDSTKGKTIVESLLCLCIGEGEEELTEKENKSVLCFYFNNETKASIYPEEQQLKHWGMVMQEYLSKISEEFNEDVSDEKVCETMLGIFEETKNNVPKMIYKLSAKKQFCLQVQDIIKNIKENDIDNFALTMLFDIVKDAHGTYSKIFYTFTQKEAFIAFTNGLKSIGINIKSGIRDLMGRFSYHALLGFVFSEEAKEEIVEADMDDADIDEKTKHTIRTYLVLHKLFSKYEKRIPFSANLHVTGNVLQSYPYRTRRGRFAMDMLEGLVQNKIEIVNPKEQRTKELLESYHIKSKDDLIQLSRQKTNVEKIKFLLDKTEIRDVYRIVNPAKTSRTMGTGGKLNDNRLQMEETLQKEDISKKKRLHVETLTDTSIDEISEAAISEGKTSHAKGKFEKLKSWFGFGSKESKQSDKEQFKPENQRPYMNVGNAQKENEDKDEAGIDIDSFGVNDTGNETYKQRLFDVALDIDTFATMFSEQIIVEAISSIKTSINGTPISKTDKSVISHQQLDVIVKHVDYPTLHAKRKIRLKRNKRKGLFHLKFHTADCLFLEVSDAHIVLTDLIPLKRQTDNGDSNVATISDTTDRNKACETQATSPFPHDRSNLTKKQPKKTHNEVSGTLTPNRTHNKVQSYRTNLSKHGFSKSAEEEAYENLDTDMTLFDEETQTSDTSSSEQLPSDQDTESFVCYSKNKFQSDSDSEEKATEAAVTHAETTRTLYESKSHIKEFKLKIEESKTLFQTELGEYNPFDTCHIKFESEESLLYTNEDQREIQLTENLGLISFPTVNDNNFATCKFKTSSCEAMVVYRRDALNVFKTRNDDIESLSVKTDKQTTTTVTKMATKESNDKMLKSFQEAKKLFENEIYEVRFSDLGCLNIDHEIEHHYSSPFKSKSSQLEHQMLPFPQGIQNLDLHKPSNEDSNIKQTLTVGAHITIKLCIDLAMTKYKLLTFSDIPALEQAHAKITDQQSNSPMSQGTDTIVRPKTINVFYDDEPDESYVFHDVPNTDIEKLRYTFSSDIELERLKKKHPPKPMRLVRSYDEEEGVMDLTPYNDNRRESNICDTDETEKLLELNDAQRPKSVEKASDATEREKDKETYISANGLVDASERTSNRFDSSLTDADPSTNDLLESSNEQDTTLLKPKKYILNNDLRQNLRLFMIKIKSEVPECVCQVSVEDDIDKVHILTTNLSSEEFQDFYSRISNFFEKSCLIVTEIDYDTDEDFLTKDKNGNNGLNGVSKGISKRLTDDSSNTESNSSSDESSAARPNSSSMPRGSETGPGSVSKDNEVAPSATSKETRTVNSPSTIKSNVTITENSSANEDTDDTSDYLANPENVSPPVVPVAPPSNVGETAESSDAQPEASGIQRSAVSESESNFAPNDTSNAPLIQGTSYPLEEVGSNNLSEAALNSPKIKKIHPGSILFRILKRFLSNVLSNDNMKCYWSVHAEYDSEDFPIAPWSIGCPVIDLESKQIYLLTTSHAIQKGTGEITEEFSYFSEYRIDGRENIDNVSNEQIGYFGKMPNGETNLYIDGLLLPVRKKYFEKQYVDLSFNHPKEKTAMRMILYRGPLERLKGQRVYKIGKRTKFTFGCLNNPDIGFYKGCEGIFAVTPLKNHPCFADHGDSGSLVFCKDPDNSNAFLALGLVMRKSSKPIEKAKGTVYCIKITSIIKYMEIYHKLKLEFFEWPEKPEEFPSTDVKKPKVTVMNADKCHEQLTL